jgi:hypothetical protein
MNAAVKELLEAVSCVICGGERSVLAGNAGSEPEVNSAPTSHNRPGTYRRGTLLSTV